MAAVEPLRPGLLLLLVRAATEPHPVGGVRQPRRALLEPADGTSPAGPTPRGLEMSELTRIRSTRSARGVAAAVAVLGLTLAAIVGGVRAADSAAVDVRTEAPSMLGGT